MKTHFVHRVQCYTYKPEAFTCVARSSDGLIAAARADGSVEVYDEKRDFVMIYRFPAALTKSVEALGWSADSRLFCTGALGRLHELDLHTASLKQSLLLTGSVVARCLVVTGDYILVGNDEGFITLFSTESSTLTQLQTFSKLSGKILAITAASGASISVNSKKQTGLIAASTDSGALVTITYTKHSSSIRHVLLSESASSTVWSLLFVNNALFSGDSCGNVCVWDPRTGGLVHTFASHVGLVLSLTASSDALTVFSGGADATVRKYECCTPNPMEIRWELAGVLRGCRRDIRGLVYIPGLFYDPEAEQHNWNQRYEPHRLLAVGLDARLQVLSCAQSETVPVGPAMAHHTLASLVGRLRHTKGPAVVAHVAALPFWPRSIAPGRLQAVQYDFCEPHERHFCLLHYPNKLILMRLAQLRSRALLDEDNQSIPTRTPQIHLAKTKRGPIQLAEIRPKKGSEIVCSAISARGRYVAYSDLQRTCVLKVSCSGRPQADETRTKVCIKRVQWKRDAKRSRIGDRTRPSGPATDLLVSSDTTDTDTNEDDDDELSPAAVARYFALEDPVDLVAAGNRKRAAKHQSDAGFAQPVQDPSAAAGMKASELPAALSLVFSPDSTSLIMVTQLTGELCAWSLDTGSERWRYKLAQDCDTVVSVHAIAVSVHSTDLGFLLALGCSDGRVRIHTVVDGKLVFTCPCLPAVSGHAPLPVRLVFAPSSEANGADPLRSSCRVKLAVLYTDNQLNEWWLTVPTVSSPVDDQMPPTAIKNLSLDGQLNAWLTEFWRVMGEEFSNTFGLIHSLAYVDFQTWLLASDRYVIQLKEGFYAPDMIRKRVDGGVQSQSDSCVTFTRQFESILQADVLNGYELSVVSIHSAAIVQQLTAPLQRKIFGL